MPWIDNRYDGYGETNRKAVYALDTYTGEAREKAAKRAESITGDDSDSARPGMDNPDNKLPVQTEGDQQWGLYLRRRAQGEHPDNFRERAAITRFPSHMQAIVTEFLGSIAEVADDAEREWGVLGEPDKAGTVMSALWRDADGSGSNWSTLLDEAGVLLSVVHHVWYCVLPPAENGGQPRFKLIELPRVVNYREEDGALVEVLVTDTVDTRTDLKDEDGETEEQYIYYTTSGWERYDKKGNAIGGKKGVWSQRFVTRDGRARVPIGRVALPLRYHAGYLTARGNIDLYNLLSDVRNLIRVANHPRLRGVEMEENEFKTTMQEMRLGSNVMMGNWEYISPDPSNAQTGYDIFKHEVRDYYITSLQQYNDAPKVKTARQVEEDSRGATAFLSVMTGALDEIENDVLHLASQIIAPSSPSKWDAAYVTRSRNFRSVDPEELAEKRTGRMKTWLDAGFSRLTALTEGAAYTEDEADDIIKRDAKSIGREVLEQ